MRRQTHYGLVFVALLATVSAYSQAQAPALPERLTTDGLFKQRPVWSPDSKQLVFARHKGETIFLFLRDLETGREKRLTDRKDPEYDAVWSPDGKRLALSWVKTSPNQGDVELYTIAADGSDAKPVAVTAGKLSHEEYPAFSPDGKRIAYMSTRDGNSEVYVADADGKNVVRLTNDPALDVHPSWSPDGKRIALATNRWGDLELALVDPDGNNLTRLTTSPGLDDYPAWSPDGKRLAFTSNRDGNFEIYLVGADGKDPVNASRHEGLDNFASWSAEGRLTWVSNRGGGFDVYAWPKTP